MLQQEMHPTNYMYLPNVAVRAPQFTPTFDEMSIL